MTAGDAFLEGTETAEDLFEDAPCGYLATAPDGRILRVNRTFEQLTGLPRDQLTQRRFADLLTGGGRIYHETHYAPLLRMQGWVREIALDIRRADGTLLPALVNSVLVSDASGRPSLIRTTVFDATDRRRYEQELLRAREREHEIALELQRSLLAGAMPTHDAFAIDVVYQPAVEGLEVGGDWYDAFWLEDGASIAVVVGDVVGRGIEAAATMGQLRSAVRALAATGLSPAGILERLDRYVERHGVGDMATIACATLELGPGILRFACAGHPPPAVLEPGRAPSFAWGGRSAPLAAYRTGVARQEAALQLADDSLVLFFTDGLFERRDRSPREGMDELLRAADARRDQPLGDMTRSVVAAMTREHRRRDDVCLLAVRLVACAGRATP